jgi:hypothetical protein
MRVFKDTKGRQWTVAVNCATVRRVRDLLKIDMLSLGDLDVELLKTLQDPVNLCNVLFVLCKEEADKAGISDLEFGKSMGGDSLLKGYEALMEELVDFFPEARKRRILRTLLSAENQSSERTLKIAEQVAGRVCGAASGSARGFWVLTQARSRWRSFWTWRKPDARMNGTAPLR